ncbi:MAG: hypothetical protein CM15mP96_3250 [Gammaproteobacteria bacterium]|nr:MAG: hypothetical protein CM15mP96_3250 [Gammaproteobacteria bacterium]
MVFGANAKITVINPDIEAITTFIDLKFKDFK